MHVSVGAAAPGADERPDGGSLGGPVREGGGNVEGTSRGLNSARCEQCVCVIERERPVGYEDLITVTVGIPSRDA